MRADQAWATSPTIARMRLALAASVAEALGSPNWPASTHTIRARGDWAAAPSRLAPVAARTVAAKPATPPGWAKSGPPASTSTVPPASQKFAHGVAGTGPFSISRSCPESNSGLRPELTMTVVLLACGSPTTSTTGRRAMAGRDDAARRWPASRARKATSLPAKGTAVFLPRKRYQISPPARTMTSAMATIIIVVMRGLRVRRCRRAGRANRSGIR